MNTVAFRMYALAAITVIVWALYGTLVLLGQEVPTLVEEAAKGVLIVWVGAGGVTAGVKK